MVFNATLGIIGLVMVFNATLGIIGLGLWCLTPL